MTVHDLICDLSERGIVLQRNGDRLTFEAPAGVLTHDDRATLRHRKLEILPLLRDVSARSTLPMAASDAMGCPEYSASERPAMAAFLAAVEAARHSTCPGLVAMSSGLVELWRYAELEAGYPLDLSGRRRVNRRKNILR